MMSIQVALEQMPQESPAANLSDISVGSETDAAAWDSFVSARPRATGYHEWAWRHVFERAFGHEPLYFAARRHGRIEGVLPLVYMDGLLFGRMLTSLPFVNYGGVIADTESAAQALLAAAVEVGVRRRCRHLELRHFVRRFPDLPCKQHKVTMHMRLGPDMWDRLDRKVRNQIRKAQKSNLTSEHGGLELLNDFYAVFARNMRDLGTPVYARRFFREVMRTFPDRAHLTIVRLADVPVAAALSYRTKSAMEVPWASSVRDYNSLCPNHLLYWSMIERAAESGCAVFDFGRSTPNEGTFKFKEQWGAEPVPLVWEYWLKSATALPNTSPSNPRLHFAIELWKKLPLSIANRLGPPIVRSIP